MFVVKNYEFVWFKSESEKMHQFDVNNEFLLLPAKPGGGHDTKKAGNIFHEFYLSKQNWNLPVTKLVVLE